MNYALGVGRLEDVERLWAQVAGRAKVDRSDNAIATALSVRVRAFLARGRVRDALASAEDGLRFAVPGTMARKRLELGRGSALVDVGRLAEGELVLEQVTSPDFGRFDQLVYARVKLGTAARLRGDRNLARRRFEDIVATEPPWTWGVAEAHNSLGDIAREEGRLDEAEAHYRAALPVHRALDGGDVPVVELNLAVVLVCRDRDGEAAAAARICRVTFERQGREWMVAAAELVHAAALAGLREWKRSRAELERGAARLGATGAVDSDFAHVAAITARRAAKALQDDLAEDAVALAAQQWEALGRSEEIDRLRAEIEAR